MKNYKVILLLTVIFILTYTGIYSVFKNIENEKVDLIVKENTNKLQINYEALLYNQKIIADAMYQDTIDIPHFIEIYSKIETASKEEKNNLRDKLKQLLSKKYKILQNQGVLQYHFLLPNNECFLRMHKQNKFGDNLTNIRADFKYTNETQNRSNGFTQGRTAHGFRNVYPIFSKPSFTSDEKINNHLGAMEISFSSESLQEYLSTVSKIHTHFIVRKDIFDTKTWQRDDLIQKYLQSAEHADFMITMTKAHTKDICIVQNKLKLNNIRDDINKNMKNDKPFSLYTYYHKNHIEVISFYPIKEFTGKNVVAWLVSHDENELIYNMLENGKYILTMIFIILLLLFYLIYRQIIIQAMIKQEHKLVNDVLNSTEDMMFVTNFKTISFSNRKFLDFFNINNNEEFNDEMKDNLLSIFTHVDGYLHEDLFKENETFIDLINKTISTERIVCMIDKSINPVAFKINITKTSFNNGSKFLVTLSDITKLKEKEKEIQNKAYIDGLTQVYNRNKFDEIALKELQRDIRYKRNLSVAIIDIDHFKNFNDTYGHLIGDEVLIMLAQTLEKEVRNTDTFARWGGEEFVILFPETKIDEVKIVCDKLRLCIEKLEHKEAGGITASFGCSQYKENDTLETMFKRCDDALYEAKDNGRNKVCAG